MALEEAWTQLREQEAAWTRAEWVGLGGVGRVRRGLRGEIHRLGETLEACRGRLVSSFRLERTMACWAFAEGGRFWLRFCTV